MRVDHQMLVATGLRKNASQVIYRGSCVTQVDVSPISLLVLQPNVLVANVTSNFKSVADVVNFARSKPGSLNFGHAGVGSGTHLARELA